MLTEARTSIPSLFGEHVRTWFRRLVSVQPGTGGRWSREVIALPDRMLLDIGIDPRSVPNPLADAISRPDLAPHGLVTPPYRSAARS